MSATSLPPERRSLWIPWAFVAFFGVVVVVNGIMITVGFMTWPGLETENAYQRGLAYERRVAAAEAQAALGWTVDVDLTREGAGRAMVELRLRNRHGHVMPDAKVRARFVRPTSEGHDFEVELPHYRDGRYRRQVELPLAGQWEVRTTIEDRAGVHHATRRVHLAP
jgi:nitrogen fixation protein FixH